MLLQPLVIGITFPYQKFCNSLYLVRSPQRFADRPEDEVRQSKPSSSVRSLNTFSFSLDPPRDYPRRK